MAIVALTAACASRVDEIELPVAPPESFSADGTADRPERWWTAFADPTLDRLVDDALAANLDLAIAWERLQEARAIARVQASDLLPDADAFLDAEVTRPEGDDDERLRLGVVAAYEVDLWGRLGSRAEAERLRAAASLADYRATALVVSAEVARTWLRVVEARRQLALLDAQIEANETVETLMENRFGSGQIRGVDVLRQRQLVEATREQRLVVEAELALLRHLLAVLLGRPPRAGPESVDGDLPSLPPLPTTGLPAELVRRRPDVERAYRELLAADRDLAAAVADRFPRLTLGASVTTAGADVGDLFGDWIRSLAGGLLAPLFRGGELAAEVDRAEAVRARRLYEYARAALAAFRDVEDALVLEARQGERIASLERQVDLAEQAHAQLRIQYFNGLGDYIDVLTALTETQRLERDLLTARRVLLEHRVALYAALAGGFATGREASATPEPTTP